MVNAQCGCCVPVNSERVKCEVLFASTTARGHHISLPDPRALCEPSKEAGVFAPASYGDTERYTNLVDHMVTKSQGLGFSWSPEVPGPCPTC